MSKNAFLISTLNNQLTFFLIRGYNIGVRLIEDFLARASLGRCADFRETAEVISKVYNKYIFLKLKRNLIKC
jgi:hypothetical protein